MQLKNHMEEVVFSMIKSVLNDIHYCTCEKCIMDIAAIALNQLPPKYVVTEKGEVFMKVNELQKQFEVDVTSAIINAAVIVRKNPKHEHEAK